MKTQLEEQIAAMTISKNTQKFLKCIVLANELYNEVSVALNLLYTERAARELMSEYEDIHENLEKEIQRFFFLSVNENIQSINCNEI
jgi:argininosuccinate lyase